MVGRALDPLRPGAAWRLAACSHCVGSVALTGDRRCEDRRTQDVTELRPSRSSDAGADGVTLRLLWPQWQGAGTASVRELAPEFPFEVARRGYAVGSAVLAAVLPANEGPTAAAPVAMDDTGLELRDGIEAKEVILTQLARAFEVIRQHDPTRIVTLGGECAMSVAPFSELVRRYGDDLAILWIDSHPDIGTPASQYPGFHAMAVAALTGHGTRTCKRCSQLPSPRTGSRWSGCTRGPRTTSATWPTGGSAPSARTTSVRRPGRCWTG
jgi:hypothetical protein